jgi:hypothetical protein
MSRLSVRLLLLVVCLAAIGGAAFLIWSTDSRTRLDADSARQFNTAARAASAGIADLRAAQQSYVAVGQGEEFWFARATQIRRDLDVRLAELTRAAVSSDATAALNAASAALQDFTQMDERARDYTRNHQLTLASDMIFADGLELTRRAGDAIERAAIAEQVARDAAAAAVRRAELLALASASGVALAGLLLLVPGRRQQADAAVTTPAPIPPPVSTVTLTQLDDFAPAQPVKTPVSPVDIGSVATLCNDLARIADTRALPSLLERAASVLDAIGIVVWIADPDGRELAPILVHGYPPQLATRLGTLARNAENLTASAYRTGLLQRVKGDSISSGAIAVPLVASGGCVGVMAAEVKNGGEQQDDRLAAATIIAAQLATLVGPPSARTKTEAAG